MEQIASEISIFQIFKDHPEWQAYVASREKGVGLNGVREGVIYHVRRMLACRTPQLGFHIYRCPDCDTARIVPHSCKSPFCSSCGKVRTDQWCEQLLSDMLDVPYRHLVFTLPWQLRLLIRDNRSLLNVLFRAAADAILSLTSGKPRPKGRKAQKWIDARRPSKKYKPGFIIVLHTFGNALNFNVHLHVIITGGGLSLDGTNWVKAPKSYLVPAPLLATEWKLNVIAGIRKAADNDDLHCRPLRKNPNDSIDIDKMLGYIRGLKWHILIGPSLAEPDQAVRYACRYSKRPVIAEMRVVAYDGTNVTFYYKDYYKGGTRVYKKIPVLQFIDMLVQHIPDKHFRQVRHYGIFSTRTRTADLEQARQSLEQAKPHPPEPTSWVDQRIAAGETDPLRCPNCGGQMIYWGNLFGSHVALANILGIEVTERPPPRSYVPFSRVTRSLSDGAIAA